MIRRHFENIAVVPFLQDPDVILHRPKIGGKPSSPFTCFHVIPKPFTTQVVDEVIAFRIFSPSSLSTSGGSATCHETFHLQGARKPRHGVTGSLSATAHSQRCSPVSRPRLASPPPKAKEEVCYDSECKHPTTEVRRMETDVSRSSTSCQQDRRHSLRTLPTHLRPQKSHQLSSIPDCSTFLPNSAIPFSNWLS